MSGPAFTGLAGLASMMAEFPRPKPRELRCAPDVVAAFREAARQAVPDFPWPGALGSLAGIPVIEKPEFMPGLWQLTEDGEMVNFGVIAR